MLPARAPRGRTWAVACALALTLSGCTAGDDPAPSGEPSADGPASAPTLSADSDGITTESGKYPTWSAEEVDVLSVPRDDFGTAVVGDDIWVLGGMTGARGNRLVSIEVLDTATGTWSTSDIEMPIGIASFEVVARGRLIYAFGGFDATSQAVDFAAVLDTRTGEWRSLPPLPHPRYAHTVTAYGSLIYVIGGRDGDRELTEVDVFDPGSETWHQAVSMPRSRARDSHKTAATPAGLVVAGGQRNFEDSDLVDLFDPTTGTWSRLPDLPEPMSRAGLAYASDKLWISLHESAYVMDARRRKTWEPANALTLSRHGMGYVPHDGYLYAIAGCALNPLRDVRTVDRMPLP